MANELGNKLSKLTPKELETFVEGLVTGVAKRFKQEMLGEWGEETSDRTLRQYRAKIARYGWKHAQKWCKWDDDGPLLMPDNTRLYYRKGDTARALLNYERARKFIPRGLADAARL